MQRSTNNIHPKAKGGVNQLGIKSMTFQGYGGILK